MPAAEATDTAYAQRLIAGDPEAWKRFSLKELQFMEWVCTRTRERSGRPFTVHDVADDVSRAMCRLLEKDRRLLRRFDGRARLSTYVGIIARTASLERLRAERARRLPEPLAEALGPSPLDGLLLKEACARVREALGRLPEPQRRVLEGFYGKGQTYEAIADGLGIPHAEVKSLLASARARLAGLLSKSQGGPADALPDAYS